MSHKTEEHFITLFDSKFLPMGLCLHASLMEHAHPFRLWVLCMDDAVLQQLSRMKLENVSLIALEEVETEALKSVKKSRSRGEYCWTLTPFTPQFVFDRAEDAERATYIDSDVYFFDSPSILLDELDESGKDVLITEHAYSPEYDKSAISGRFCVQFITFRRNHGGMKVMQWWQERCLEWCYSRLENGKFGDQKYLDAWPEIFGREVHILRQIENTLAPWNLTRFASDPHSLPRCVLFHFHSLRILGRGKILLYTDYRLRGLDSKIYEHYLACLKRSLDLMSSHGISAPIMPLRGNILSRMLRTARSKILGKLKVAFIQ